MVVFDFLHKASLLFSYSPTKGRWRTWAGMRDGKEYDIVKAPQLFGKDEWGLDGGKVVSSREIYMMLDRGDYGY